MIKDFALRERWRLQFRAEFFNLFNQVNFGCLDTTWGCYDPIATVNSPSFGQLTSAGPGREIRICPEVALVNFRAELLGRNMVSYNSIRPGRQNSSCRRKRLERKRAGDL